MARIAARHGYDALGPARLVHNALSARRLGFSIVTHNLADFFTDPILKVAAKAIAGGTEEQLEESLKRGWLLRHIPKHALIQEQHAPPWPENAGPAAR